MAKLPLNLTKSLKALKEASASAAESASIVLAGDQALVERARERFAQGGAVPSSHAGSLSGPAGVAPAPDEVLVVLTTPDKEAEVEASLAAVAAKGPVIVAVDGGPGTRNQGQLSGRRHRPAVVLRQRRRLGSPVLAVRGGRGGQGDRVGPAVPRRAARSRPPADSPHFGAERLHRPRLLRPRL